MQIKLLAAFDIESTRALVSNSMMKTLSINGDRLWQSLMALAQIGATEKGGVCRLALTKLDREARDLFVQTAQHLGCTVRIDEIGNIFARRAGTDPKIGAVATGSHIDTQPTGGKFDGNYGVLAGLEVIHTLNDHNIKTKAAIEVCVWTNEEGSRFVPVMMGSGVYAGAFSVAHAHSATDKDGVSVEQALSDMGYKGTSPAIANQLNPAHRIEAFFEVHIEQGPVLEDAGITIGAVTGALGQRWYDITVTGQEAHAGPTPMPLRKDALQHALALMEQVQSIALAEQPHARGTVGYVEVFPNSRNVIPGRVTFSVDFRHSDDVGLDRMDAALRRCCETLVKQGRVQLELKPVVYFAPTVFDKKLVAAVRTGALAHGFEAMDIVSGAGHDAVYVSRIAPTAMIFIPCKDGISHNEIEDAKAEHITAGANVLLHAMLSAADM